ncbi:MAG: hypothetical protein ACRC2R_07790 [Xenococcaceae cyanobacterium]
MKRISNIIQGFLGFCGLIFLFGGCVYSIGYPWNCEQAKDDLEEKEQKLATAFDEAKEPWKYDKSSQQAETSIMIAIDDKMDAERIEYKKCY